MASRIIHLAITGELIKQYEFKDLARLRFGTILPDAACNKEEYQLSHFKMKIGDKSERSYNLSEFRTKFSEKMKTDDLYLGYYLHLIQDLLYRNFVYERYHWDPKPEGNMERLYSDYRQLNRYVIDKYGLHCDVNIPEEFETEIIHQVAAFEPGSFLVEYKKDFEPLAPAERFFFTDAMVDKYIGWAVEYCKKELEALKAGAHYFDELKWSWGK